MGHRVDIQQGTIRYRVKWEGYDDESDKTWEPEKNLKCETANAVWKHSNLDRYKE